MLRSMIRSPRIYSLSLLLLVALPSVSRPALAQKPRVVSMPGAEARTSKAFEDARRMGPPALRAFLYRMPKGADLHNHLSGAIYAESWIRVAGQDRLCINTQTLSFAKPDGSACKTGEVPASTAPLNQPLYDRLIDAFSMRTFVPTTANSGHDHFFETFERFGGTSKAHMGEWLDEVATRAAAQNEQYLELMDTPNFEPAAALAEKIGFNPDFAQYRQQLLSAGFRNLVPAAQARFNQAEAEREKIEHCGQADATSSCKVEIRFIYQVLRDKPPSVVFAQILLGFEAASTDPQIVGINLVQPEDGYFSMRDYRIHMQMLNVMHRLYPNVHITLHAGELAFGMVPPAGLTFHIRDAVEEGHAERIGHGVDIMYETDPYQLLREMADKHIMVEINLTSNDVILNVKGRDHPFMIYRKFGVPFALSTDDAGVSRIDLTHEYVRAADTYPLSYLDFKKMVRTSLEHAFLPGASLWQFTTPETLDKPVAVCAGQLGWEKPTGACARFITGSQKAQQQWELERRFHVFEASF
jgi:adenosine deaminase